MRQPRPLFKLFSSFQTLISNFETNKYVKNVHPVYCAGIRTHDLWHMTLLPLALDQGSHPLMRRPRYLSLNRDNEQSIETEQNLTEAVGDISLV